MRTVWLPGDELSVTEIELRRAVRRDNQLTQAEMRIISTVWACLHASKTYRWWKCSHSHPCMYCEDIYD